MDEELVVRCAVPVHLAGCEGGAIPRMEGQQPAADVPGVTNSVTPARQRPPDASTQPRTRTMVASMSRASRSRIAAFPIRSLR